MLVRRMLYVTMLVSGLGKLERNRSWQSLERENGSRLFVISKMNSDVGIDRHGMSLLCEHFCIIRLLLKRGRHKLLRGGSLRMRRTIDCERSRKWRSKERESK